MFFKNCSVQRDCKLEFRGSWLKIWFKNWLINFLKNLKKEFKDGNKEFADREKKITLELFESNAFDLKMFRLTIELVFNYKIIRTHQQIRLKN